MFDTDVFVAGGGPAGLATALALRAKGLDVMVADASRPPIDKACGEGLMPDSLAALRSLGVDTGKLDGYPFQGIRFAEEPKSFHARFPNGFGLGIRRTALHEAMIEAAGNAGAHLMWGARVTGVAGTRAIVNDETIRACWIIAADGLNSRVRVWADLDQPVKARRRFGFRRHYAIEPWTEFMEIYWGTSSQIYVTPVGPKSVCVALITRDSHDRLDDAFPRFPEIAERLKNADAVTEERGGVTLTRRFRSVHRGSVALIGDASGSVDAITGEGLCLAFQQARALADAIERGDLSSYAAEHERILKKPGFMAALMLSFDGHPRWRDRVFRALDAKPRVFGDMLAMHVGELKAGVMLSSGLSIASHMVTGGVL